VTSDGRIRLLVLSPIPEEGAGCRFRIAQFIPYLEANGFEVTLRALFTTEFFRQVYRPGNYLAKALTFTTLSLKRLDSLRDVSQFDVVLIYREVFPVGPALVERLLTSAGRPPVVFDFDDAIFLPSVSDANRLIGVLKHPQKIRTILRRSRHVIAGNTFLADYARRFNSAVTVIPTCVDTSQFAPAAAPVAHATPIVGWIGSPTTAAYIHSLVPVLQRVRERRPFTLRVSGTGEPLRISGVEVDNVPWSLDRDVELFNSCDVGVYPLPDEEWSKGKCGFKAIQFMACGVPVVAAAVGVNREIIRDGVNGFLAATPGEWVEKLDRLLGDPELRRRFSEAGRRTVVEHYSLRKNAPILADMLRGVVDRAAAQKRKSA
jgi:glycosyltransferase involved in cell wall biosynthesis